MRFYQIPAEEVAHQFRASDFPDIVFCSNRHYAGHNDELWVKLEDIGDVFLEHLFTSPFPLGGAVRAAIAEVWEEPLSPGQWERLQTVFEQEGMAPVDVQLAVFSILKGQEYRIHTVRGLNVHEWQNIVVPTDMLDSAIAEVQSRLFCTGTEWCYSDSGEVKRIYVPDTVSDVAYIRGRVGVEPELYRFNGWAKMAKYRKD